MASWITYGVPCSSVKIGTPLLGYELMRLAIMRSWFPLLVEWMFKFIKVCGHPRQKEAHPNANNCFC